VNEPATPLEACGWGAASVAVVGLQHGHPSNTGSEDGDTGSST
jgi:hypothetical protein